MIDLATDAPRAHHDHRGPDRVRAPATRSCLVTQREVGDDTGSFADALKHALRQDPDVILVGEMRDLETIPIAITAAETGHLVLATLHTRTRRRPSTASSTCSPAPAAADPRAARRRAAGGGRQPLCPGRRPRPRRRRRGHGGHAGHPQPDPRGQDPPDPVAMQTGARTACTLSISTSPSWYAAARITYDTGFREVPPRGGLTLRMAGRHEVSGHDQDDGLSTTQVRDRAGKDGQGSAEGRLAGRWWPPSSRAWGTRRSRSPRRTRG